MKQWQKATKSLSEDHRGLLIRCFVASMRIIADMTHMHPRIKVLSRTALTYKTWMLMILHIDLCQDTMRHEDKASISKRNMMQKLVQLLASIQKTMKCWMDMAQMNQHLQSMRTLLQISFLRTCTRHLMQDQPCIFCRSDMTGHRRGHMTFPGLVVACQPLTEMMFLMLRLWNKA